MNRDDRGSTIPLIVGFFVLGLLVVAGSVVLADSFTRQRDTQDRCDGVATAVAATAIDLRGGAGPHALFSTAAVDAAVYGYLARDRDRERLDVRSSLSPDRTTVTLRCVETDRLAFGAVFGLATVRHVAQSSAQANVSG